MMTAHFRVGSLIKLSYYCDFSCRAKVRMLKSISFSMGFLQSRNLLRTMTVIHKIFSFDYYFLISSLKHPCFIKYKGSELYNKDDVY